MFLQNISRVTKQVKFLILSKAEHIVLKFGTIFEPT